MKLNINNYVVELTEAESKQLIESIVSSIQGTTIPAFDIICKKMKARANNTSGMCVRSCQKKKIRTDYVNLGLPSGTLWCKYNIGASRPEECGEYFEFGSTEKYKCPTMEQVKELIDECAWTETKLNGVDGMMVVGPNGNSIFLPSGGFQYVSKKMYSKCSLVGQYGYYWAAEDREECCRGCTKYIYSDSMYWHNKKCDFRYLIRTVTQH